jgi:hypothetical protein
MNLNPDRFQGKSKRKIIRELVEHVSTSEADFENKSHRSGSNTDLNLYILDNKGFEIGTLDRHINHITTSNRASGYAKNFIADHTFSEELLDDDITLVRITTPEKGRTDDSIWFTNDGYVWVLTTEPRDWREKTVENLIKYLPQVERLYLSSDDLEALTGDIISSHVSGFTAEYYTAYSERQATLVFHGARDGDLEKVKNIFDAMPTRIEFDQTNSPTAAIQGASNKDGRITIRSVIQGSQTKAVETLCGVSNDYQELDKQSFEVEHQSRHKQLDNGFTVDGFTAIELTDPDREKAENLMKELKEELLNSHQYQYGRRGDDTLRVYDSRHEEIFDIALEQPNIILYPRESATALSLRSFVQNVFEKFDSTYSLSKVENSIAVI